MKKRVSNRIKLLVVSLVLMFVAIVIGLRMPDLFVQYEMVPDIIRSVCFSTVCLSVFMAAVSFTFTNQNRVYEIMKSQDDEILFDVRNIFALRSFIIGLVVVAMIAGLALGFALTGYSLPWNSAPAICAYVIALLMYFIFWLVLRLELNPMILVGNRVVVACDSKKRTAVYEVNQITSVDRRYNRKAYTTRYFFRFPTGSFSIREEDGFKARCMIAYLSDICDKKEIYHPFTTEHRFNDSKTIYTIDSFSDIKVVNSPANVIPWKRDKEFARKVRSEAVFNVFASLFLVLLLGSIGYGFIYALFGFRKLLTIGFLILCLAFYLWLCASDFARWFGTIYRVDGRIARKYQVVRKFGTLKPDFLVDIQIDGEKGITKVVCSEAVFREAIPGETVVRLSKTKLSKPKIFYDSDDISGR